MYVNGALKWYIANKTKKMKLNSENKCNKTKNELEWINFKTMIRTKKKSHKIWKEYKIQFDNCTVRWFDFYWIVTNTNIIIIIISHADECRALATDDWLNSVLFLIVFRMHCIYATSIYQPKSVHCVRVAVNCWHSNRFYHNVRTAVHRQQ